MAQDSSCRDEEESIQLKPVAGQITPLIQRQVEPEEEEEETLQTKLIAGQIMPLVQRQVGPEEEEEELIQTKQVDGQTHPVSPGLKARIHNLRGSGQPLSKSVRDFFEPRFGYDFSQVRVHTDTRATEAAQAVNGRAFTVGRDVVFGTGQYTPIAAEGKRLLAHELTHIVQQSRPSFPYTQSLQRHLNAPPRRLVTSYSQSVGYPEEDEAKLNAKIKSRQNSTLPSGKGMYLGTDQYVKLPPSSSKKDVEADIKRRAVKKAILDIISSQASDWVDSQIHVRVPLSDAPVVLDYAMVVLRFDKQRNVEATYAGVHRQRRGYFRTDEAIELEGPSRAYGVTFVTDNITLKWGKKIVKFVGKQWGSNDIALLQQVFPLLGTQEKTAIRGVKFRRLTRSSFGHAAGFYTNKDHSINLMDAALPIDKEIWFGEGGKFYSRGVHTLLHEIGHTLEERVKVRGSKSKKSKTKLIAHFKKVVHAEFKKRFKKSPVKKPPPKLGLPTDYSKKNWSEFFADTYAIYITNPSFLNTKKHKYLYDFFTKYLPK